MKPNYNVKGIYDIIRKSWKYKSGRVFGIKMCYKMIFQWQNYVNISETRGLSLLLKKMR